MSLRGFKFGSPYARSCPEMKMGPPNVANALWMPVTPDDLLAAFRFDRVGIVRRRDFEQAAIVFNWNGSETLNEPKHQALISDRYGTFGERQKAFGLVSVTTNLQHSPGYTR